MSLERATVESLVVEEAVLSVAMDHLLEIVVLLEAIVVLLEAVAVVLSGVMGLVALEVIADRLDHLAVTVALEVAVETVVVATTWVD
jgi:hypothetical protein